LLSVFDEEHIDWTLGGIEPESHLFLNRGENPCTGIDWAGVQLLAGPDRGSGMASKTIGTIRRSLHKIRYATNSRPSPSAQRGWPQGQRRLAVGTVQIIEPDDHACQTTSKDTEERTPLLTRA
jgi:hypothetical protein